MSYVPPKEPPIISQQTLINSISSTSSTSPVMMGLAITYTPKTTGRIKITSQALYFNNTAADGLTATLKYGTGNAPANGVAGIGTQAGQQGTIFSGGAGNIYTITLVAIVAGLILGTKYWFDVAYNVILGGTCTPSNMTFIIEEL